MATTVTLRVSRTMAQPDLDALRSWLERTHPGDWQLTSGPDTEGTLGVTDSVLHVVLEGLATGAGGATVKILHQEVKDWFERTRKKYPEGAKPDFTLESHDEAAPADRQEQ